MCCSWGVARHNNRKLIVVSIHKSFDAAKNAANNGEIVGMFTRHFLATRPGLAVRFVNNIFFLPED